MAEKKKPEGLDLLRDPFPPNQISKLPKPTKAQTDEVRADFKKGVRCEICGGWHHPKVVHLDYVGHAALTDRLLDCDPAWNWEPLARTELGTPALDDNGGMWIALTVCGVTRLGYGHPDGKRGGDAIKETIGDALRNAAMRFGAALDLWHKGDLHGDEEPAQEAPEPKAGKAPVATPIPVSDEQLAELEILLDRADLPTADFLEKAGQPRDSELSDFPAARFAAAVKGLKKKIETMAPAPSDLDRELEDSIPY